jgi:hypothetical protein
MKIEKKLMTVRGRAHVTRGENLSERKQTTTTQKFDLYSKFLVLEASYFHNKRKTSFQHHIPSFILSKERVKEVERERERERVIAFVASSVTVSGAIHRSFSFLLPILFPTKGGAENKDCTRSRLFCASRLLIGPCSSFCGTEHVHTRRNLSFPSI